MRWMMLGLLVGCGGDAGSVGAACDYEGVTYEDGESFPDVDGCNTCTCEDGNASCTEIGCVDDTAR